LAFYISCSASFSIRTSKSVISDWLLDARVCSLSYVSTWFIRIFLRIFEVIDCYSYFKMDFCFISSFKCLFFYRLLFNVVSYGIVLVYWYYGFGIFAKLSKSAMTVDLILKSRGESKDKLGFKLTSRSQGLRSLSNKISKPKN